MTNLYIALGFVLGASAEISLLRGMGDLISITNTLSEIMLTFIVGIFLGRSWGDDYFQKLQWHLRSCTLPADETVNGALMACASMALITPGVISDVLGLLILIPATRPIFKRLVLKLVKTKIAQGQQYFFVKD